VPFQIGHPLDTEVSLIRPTAYPFIINAYRLDKPVLAAVSSPKMD